MTTSAFSLRDNVRLLLVPRKDAVPAATGLRALSMMWVLLQHVQQGLRPLALTPRGARFLEHPALAFGWAGNLAVEIFFVLSGYLIGGMLLREHAATGTIVLRKFYARRALRILPVYLLAMAVNLLLSEPNSERVWANIFFVNNFVPFTQQFMAHGWTLAIEEQFYAGFPLLALGLHRLRRPWPARLLGLGVVVALVVAVAIVFFQDIELSLRFPDATAFWHYMDAFYVKPYTRFGSIAMGLLVAQLEYEGGVLRWLERRRLLPPGLVVIALAAMVFVIVVFPEGRTETGERRILGAIQLAFGGYLFGAATAIVLLVSRTEHAVGRAISRALGARVLHPFAQLSYAAYLFHPVLIAPLFPLLGFDLEHPWWSYARITGCVFLVTYAVAATVFVLFECPIMRLRPPARATIKASAS